MILSSKYVILNFPKTGSTFTRKMIERLEDGPLERLFWGKFLAGSSWTPSRPGKRAWLKRQAMRLPVRYGLSRPVEVYFPKLADPDQPPDQHGGASQIPREFRRLPVAVCIRHPLDRIVSQYHFAWYARYPAAPVETLKEAFPSFPDLTFEEYLEYVRRYVVPSRLSAIGTDRRNVGSQTVDFIQMLSVSPVEMLDRLDDEFVNSGKFLRYLPPRLNLLRNERLNDDLVDFLNRVGYDPSDTAFIPDAGRIQPREGTSRAVEDAWTNYYTPAEQSRVVEEERLLLGMLERLGVDIFRSDEDRRINS